MNDQKHDIYAEYFKLRNVDAGYYGNYKLPEYLKQVLPVDKKQAVLDIGCGFGQTLKALREAGYENLSGIDISKEAVESCVEAGLNVTKIDAITTYCAQSEKRFDFIIMSHVIEHIEKSEIIETLRAIRNRLLNDGGAFMVMTPNAQAHTGCYWAYEDFTHTTIFTAGSLLFVLRNAGFEQVAFIDPDGKVGSHLLVRVLKWIFLPYYKVRIEFWNRITNSSFHRLSPQIHTFEIKALAR